MIFAMVPSLVTLDGVDSEGNEVDEEDETDDEYSSDEEPARPTFGGKGRGKTGGKGKGKGLAPANLSAGKTNKSPATGSGKRPASSDDEVEEVGESSSASDEEEGDYSGDETDYSGEEDELDLEEDEEGSESDLEQYDETEIEDEDEIQALPPSPTRTKSRGKTATDDEDVLTLLPSANIPNRTSATEYDPFGGAHEDPFADQLGSDFEAQPHASTKRKANMQALQDIVDEDDDLPPRKKHG